MFRELFFWYGQRVVSVVDERGRCYFAPSDLNEVHAESIRLHKSLSYRREPVSRMVIRYWVPAFAGTTHYFPLSWQLLVVERKYLRLKA